MKLTTVGELKSLLEEFDEETQIMAMHQPGWPLVEEIKGIYDPKQGACPDCEHYLFDHFTKEEFEEENYGEEDSTCKHCECGYLYEKSLNLLYLIVDGCPYDMNPYGNKEAFNDYLRI